jgi:hypothetical protein
MMKRMLMYMLMVAMTNLTFGGCSSVVNIPLDEVKCKRPKRIDGFVTKSGEVLTFDRNGGEYEPAFKRISGKTAEGESVIKPLMGLDSVRVIVPTGDSLSPISIGARFFNEYSRPGKTDVIVSVLTKDSIAHKFWVSAEIDPQNKMIFGLSEARTSLIIPFDSVTCVGIRKPDAVKTGLLITGCLVVLTAMTIYGIRQALEHSFDNAEWTYDH